MGLAASQARFLGITARKSNIEYEGQQVNQQRTALAEEVNALYNKLLSVKVPIAPDATEFYESDYSFTASNTQGYDGDYIIKSYYPNNDEQHTYYVNAVRTYTGRVANGTVCGASSLDTENKVFTSADGEKHDLDEEENTVMVDLINQTYPKQTPLAQNEKFYTYTSQSGSDKGVKYYIPQSTLQPEKSFSLYNETNKTMTQAISFPEAKMTQDANGRMSSIQIETPDGEYISSDVSTTRVYDSEGYDAALRDYTMSKEEYDKKVADLNAQTESLQQEDKVLEMRLNQIDTEQNELQTELDAVKAVLDKNIEKTFNTFS